MNPVVLGKAVDALKSTHDYMFQPTAPAADPLKDYSKRFIGTNSTH